MATVTLTATNYSTTNVATVTNASNAYTDTTSSTYAQVTTTSSSSSKAYFYGFDFSQIPNGATITSVTYKIKVKTVGTGGSTFYVFLENRNTTSELSAKTSTASTTSETVVTLTPTSATWSDIVAMGDNFAFCVQHSRTTRTQNVYGMEIDVTYTIPYVPNKVIYGGNTLIDLTADTVTAADVLSGVTFHLPNGNQSVGEATSASLKKATASGRGGSQTMSFSDLESEPSWFVCIEMAGENSSTYAGVAIMKYDENDFVIENISSSGYVVRGMGLTGSFSYSSGTLTITIQSSTYFGYGTYELYYL